MTAFLLVIAWGAWPTAVLVMCCAAGTLLTLQYLVFGFHRLVNFCIWAVWKVSDAVRGVFARPVPVTITVPPVDLSDTVEKL